MRIFTRILITSMCAGGLACSPGSEPSAAQASAGLDSLNARLVQAYRDRDAGAYAALFTDTAMFEWPAIQTVRGPAELEAMARSNWLPLRDMDLRLNVSSRRFAEDHVTEFGAFEQSWNDSTGVRMTEFGRYAALLVREVDGSWRMDRFLGFEDSTRRQARIVVAGDELGYHGQALTAMRPAPLNPQLAPSPAARFDAGNIHGSAHDR